MRANAVVVCAMCYATTSMDKNDMCTC